MAVCQCVQGMGAKVCAESDLVGDVLYIYSVLHIFTIVCISWYA